MGSYEQIVGKEACVLASILCLFSSLGGVSSPWTVLCFDQSEFEG